MPNLFNGVIKGGGTKRTKAKSRIKHNVGNFSYRFTYKSYKAFGGFIFNLFYNIVKNFFDHYKMTVKDMEGNDKVVYGFIADNSDRTYLSLNDIAFAKRLYKREIKKVEGEETTTYTPIEKRVLQGDLAILFDLFKGKYKDALTAMDLLYLALAKHNESKFTTECYIYPTECFQCFKGEYNTSNFYMFNLKIGGTDADRLNEIFADICKDYEESLKDAE